MRARNQSLVVASFSIFTLGFLSIPHADAQIPSNETLISKVDALAATVLTEPGAAGLSVAIARGDTMILDKGYGKADLEHGTPATDATLFRIASLTKQYTAAAIMKLAEEGKLGLDDDITKYVHFPTQGKTVTIRHLLNHTSGIKNYTSLPEDSERTVIADLPPERILEPLRTLPFDFEPGAGWAYSNSGYHLLGMIIEKLSGKPYADYLQQDFFTPLQLIHTRYDVNSEVIPGRARGYRLIDGKTANAVYANMSVPYSAGSLMASAGDVVRWQLALVNGSVVSLDSYKQMTTAATLADGSPTDYGFGLRMRDLDGHPRIMHGGGIHGFNSIISYYPVEKVSIAIIANSESVSTSRLEKEIAREALGIAPNFKDLALPAAELDALTGTYRFKEIELDIVVTVARGKLVVQGTGEPPVTVLAQGAGEFRVASQPEIKLVFDPPAKSGDKSPSLTLEQGGTFKGLRIP